jgi:molybdopterin-containing oxidoreductase family membrane subunit
MARIHLLGIYNTAEQAAEVTAIVRAERLGEVTTYTPALDHDIDAALGPRVSAVRVFTLIGGMLGCVVGFALPIATVRNLPLITGGKPLISIPPFVVIAFELTILVAALSAVVGFLILGGLPRFRRAPLYDHRFSEDRWGVLVTCDAERADAVRAELARGAEEVRYANG